MTPLSDDTLSYAPEPSDSAGEVASSPWRVLVVDDDRDAHDATAIALRGESVCGRPLQLVHAFDAAEAERVVCEQDEFAVILLDVVMETPHAGLALVDAIRRRLGHHRPRIILRTGQPGYAPELRVVRELDINDYRTKQSLSRTKLLTLLNSAVRAYRQILDLDRAQAGMERIAEACGALAAEQDERLFGAQLLRRLAEVLQRPADGVLATSVAAGGGSGVIASSGRFEGSAEPWPASPLAGALQRTLHDGQWQLEAGWLALPLQGSSAGRLAIGLLLERPLDEVEQRLLRVFAHSLAGVVDAHRLRASLHATAYRDGLLGIANRAAICLEIDSLLQAGSSQQALALIDVDQFSEINEAFGDGFGDALLHAVAERLRRGFDAGVLVGRIANDTFGVLAAWPELDGRRIAGLFAAPFDVDGTAISLTVSSARVALGAEVTTGSQAIKFAYSALKRAKAQGPGSQVGYSREFGEEIAQRTRLLQDLHAAFDHDRLYLCFQPQLDIVSARVVGVEALMRWRSEAGVTVPPDRFIPIAEQSGLIRPLGVWALRRALAAAVALRAAGHTLRMAVNVSIAQLIDPEFEAMLEAALADSAVEPGLLELEITESVAMQSPELISSKLQRLRQRGLAIAIDDFGTGFSSLAYLERLAVDRLKIDRSFILSLGRENSGARIAEMVIELGKTLGLKVIAEGIESQAHLDRLVELGCDEAQGYLFSPPLELPALLQWLQLRR